MSDNLNTVQNCYLIHIGDTNYDSTLQIAEKFKEEGNTFLKANKFEQAVEKYTDAINLKVETKKNAIYYANRAFANLKLENYGLTKADSNEAIKCDAEYIKAYYRRATANLCLSLYDEALKDFNYLRTKLPNDKDLIEKINMTIKKKKQENFFKAFSSEGRGSKTPTLSLTESLKKLTIESDYAGIRIPEDGKIDEKWILNLIENMKQGKYLHKKDLCFLLVKVKETLEKQESLIDITVKQEEHFTVCGDIHGQFYDLLNIFKINGYPSESNPYLFNGDFVDRGVFGLECITTLLCFKYLYPNHFFMARGNHEGRNLNRIYGFSKEVTDKYDQSVYDWFVEFFTCLPLGHVFNHKILVVHGGLFSKDGVKLEDIKKINRFMEIPEFGLMNEILWTDPCRQPGRQPSKRGVGISFGPDIAEKFLAENGLELLIRSHEVKQNGYEIEPNGKVVTVFSAPNYCDQMGNKGAFVKLVGEEVKQEYVTYEAVSHPSIPITKYMTPWMV